MTIRIPPSCRDVMAELEVHQYAAYVVGGCVRDALLGEVPHDWDICTDASPEDVCAIFREKGMRVVETGIQHGTVTVVANDGQAYEVTTYRIDGTYSDGRHPDNVVLVADLKTDLARRDFTINAMAYHPELGIVDPFDGQADLASRIIRCVGNPDSRFNEDALRILRALRFASSLDFTIESETKKSILKNKALLKNISAERLRDELNRTIVGKNVWRIMQTYRDVYAEFIPELAPCFDFNQRNPYHCHDVWNHTLTAVERIRPELPLRLAMLFHDIGKPECFSQDENGVGHFYGHPDVSAGLTERIMRRLKYDNDTIRIVSELVAEHDRIVEPSHKSVRRLLSKLGKEQATRWLAVREADIYAQDSSHWVERLEKVKKIEQVMKDILSQQDCLSLKDLAVNGNDLIAAGVPMGPEVGKALNRLLDAVLEDPTINTKEKLLAIL